VNFPWNRLPPSPAPSSDLATRALEARVQALEDRHAHIAADAGLLRVEWSEILDKIQHWASRQSARDQKAAKRGLDALAAAQEPAGDTNGEGPVPQSHLTGKAALRARLRARTQIGG